MYIGAYIRMDWLGIVEKNNLLSYQGERARKVARCRAPTEETDKVDEYHF